MNEREEIPPWMIVLGLGALAYVLFEVMKVPAAIANNPVTQGVSSAIASVYGALTFGPPISATGKLAAQSGAVLGPISSFPAATDASGNTYLNVNGTTYQLGPRNSAGNFTAIPTASYSAPTPSGNTASVGSTGATGGTGATSFSGFLR